MVACKEDILLKQVIFKRKYYIFIAYVFDLEIDKIFFSIDFAYSTPNWSQQGEWNGSPYRGGRGSGGFTPRGRGGSFTPRGRGGGFTPRGRDGGFTPRGNFTPRGGRGGHQDNSNRSYFHPSMLEDPWAQLMNKNNR